MSVNRIYHLRTKPLAEKVFRGPHHDSVFLKEMRESLPGLSLDRTPDLHPFLVPSLIPGQPTVRQTSDRNRSHIFPATDHRATSQRKKSFTSLSQETPAEPGGPPFPPLPA